MKVIIHILVVFCLILSPFVSNASCCVDNAFKKECSEVCHDTKENNSTDSDSKNTKKCCTGNDCACVSGYVLLAVTTVSSEKESAFKQPYVEKQKILSKYDKYSFYLTCDIFHPPQIYTI